MYTLLVIYKSVKWSDRLRMNLYIGLYTPTVELNTWMGVMKSTHYTRISIVSRIVGLGLCEWVDLRIHVSNARWYRYYTNYYTWLHSTMSNTIIGNITYFWCESCTYNIVWCPLIIAYREKVLGVPGDSPTLTRCSSSLQAHKIHYTHIPICS